ncbi:MAG: hypothetical protein BWY91_02567 [bacterium ADurb.BinA028]|nr:MAG: hypothetical protein BWY91_02567 [bacterium ADurb.BinA028]
MTVALLRIGTARLLIWMSLRSRLGICRTVAAVICLSTTVICTWTLPKRVGTAAPAKVVPSALDAEPFDDPPVVPLPVPADPPEFGTEPGAAPFDALPGVTPEALTVEAVLEVDVW